MKFFTQYIRQHLTFMLLPILGMFITLGIDIFFPYLQGKFVDEILVDGKTDLLGYFLITFGILILVNIIFAYLKEYLFDVFSVRVSKTIRQDLFYKMQTLPFSFFDKTNTGELMSRLGEDVDIVWETIAYGLRLVIEIIILVTSISILMFLLHPTLALICLVILLPIAIMSYFFEKKFWAVYTEISDQTAKINSVAQQNISGIRLVKALARERHEILKFLESNQELYSINMKQAKIARQFIPLTEFLTYFAHIVIIILGGYFVIQEQITLGVLVMFSNYVLSLSWCVRSISYFITMLSQNKASMNRIYKVLDTESTITSPKNGFNPKSFKGEIHFKDVSFSYEDKPVLHRINLFISSGHSVAIMGPTGCGKSTLLSLIGRYYDVTSGEILVDGVNVKEWDLQALRKYIGIVFQDTFLFSDSIKNNINFGEIHSESKVNIASKLSCSHKFISELKEGIHTLIGERGLGLSGGQKQRLTIARAIAADTPILILDDATSALDMETEYTVLQNLESYNQQATKLIVAHRISAVKNADLILYMEHGKIIEQGAHHTLLEKQGAYASIYHEQFKDFNIHKEVSKYVN